MILDIKQAQYAEIAPFLQAAIEHDTSGGSEGVRDLSDQALLFKLVNEADQVLGGYSLRLNSHQLRRVCWILAAGGRIRGIDLTKNMLPVVTEQAKAAGASQLAIVTKRSGLVHKLQNLGFVATGIELRKNIV